MKRLLIIITLLTFIDVYALQQRVSISPGFFTGRDFFDMTDGEKRAYTTGAVNGMLVSPLFGAPEDRVAWLKTCTVRLSDEEITGILSKYISSDSNQMTQNLNVVTFNALKDTCEKTK